MRAIFKTDFDLKKQVKVTSKHTGISLFVTPRYIDHYVKHEYEPFSVALVQQLIARFDTFVDIGAHYGYYSLVAHQKNSKVKVIAIEPVAENFALLEKNLKTNEVSFETHNIAASNKDAIVSFNLIEASDSCSFYSHPLAEISSTTTVKAKKLDPILKGKTLFIKMDVEGHEMMVLDGMRNVLSKKPPLLIEFNPDCQKMAGFEPEDILKKLAKLNYDVYLLNETSYEYHRFDARKPKSWRLFMSEHGYCNILCMNRSERDALKNIFDALLTAKFIGVEVETVTNSEKTMVALKAQLEKKLRLLEKQKTTNQAKLHKIMKSDYFKVWQYIANLLKKPSQ